MIGILRVLGAIVVIEMVSVLITAIITGITTLLLDRLLFRDVEPDDLPLAEAKVVRR